MLEEWGGKKEVWKQLHAKLKREIKDVLKQMRTKHEGIWKEEKILETTKCS